MIKSISVGQQTVTPQSPVNFETNTLFYCNDVGHAAGTGTFSLVKCGLYDVYFNGTITNPGEAGTAVTLQLSLELDGENIPGSEITLDVDDVNERPVSLSTIVKAYRECSACRWADNTPVALRVVNSGTVPLALSNVSLSVSRRTGGGL